MSKNLKYVTPQFKKVFIFLFIHDYGNTGVAAAISISMIINLFIMDYLYKRDINIHLFKNTFFSFRNG